MPQCVYFKPQGIPMRILEQISLTVDEFEAVRLADLQRLYQADAAERMGISRQTFGRILDSAHQKIADALAHGKALRIEGGSFELTGDEQPQNMGMGRCGHGRGRHRCGRGHGGPGQ